MVRSSNLKLIVIVTASAAGLTAGILWGRSKSDSGGGGPPPSPPDTGNATWFCSLHAEDIGFNLTNASRTFAAAHDLGCRGIRTDISWSDLEPNKQGVWDTTKVDFYTKYFAAAQETGLALLPILSHAPNWAKTLYKSNVTAFLDAAETFAGRALEVLPTCKPVPPVKGGAPPKLRVRCGTR